MKMDAILNKRAIVDHPPVFYLPAPTMASLNSSQVNLMGLVFEYNAETETFELVVREYTLFELFQISKLLSKTLNSVNERGYFSSVSNPYSFVQDILKVLSTHGYKTERVVLGGNDNTYTLWYNVIFINYFYLILAKLKELEKDSYFMRVDFCFD
jgi:hypothetical protein